VGLNCHLRRYVNLEEGYGRQNFTTFDETAATLGSDFAHSKWGVVPDGTDDYTSCLAAETPDPTQLPSVVGPCRLAMADDFSRIYDYQLYSVYTGVMSTVDFTTLPACVTSAGMTNVRVYTQSDVACDSS
jgi:hypothetical protein